MRCESDADGHRGRSDRHHRAYRQSDAKPNADTNDHADRACSHG
jgi:hypothetical protein